MYRNYAEIIFIGLGSRMQKIINCKHVFEVRDSYERMKRARKKYFGYNLTLGL